MRLNFLPIVILLMVKVNFRHYMFLGSPNCRKLYEKGAAKSGDAL